MVLIDSDKEHCSDILEGIAYHESGVVCYSEGLSLFLRDGGECDSLRHGRFFIKYKANNKVVIRTDDEGNELIFYYKNNSYWCVSTSFLGIVEHLSSKGFELSASKLEFAKMFVQTSLFEQPYNKNLPIKEVSLLESKEKIIIDEKGFNVVKIDDGDEQVALSFYEGVANFIEEARTLIGALSSFPDVDLELSGGIDSRIVLGLSLPYKDSLNVSSNKARRDDYIVARALSKSFNLRFNGATTEVYGRNSRQKKWLLYKLSNVGVSRTNPLPNGASGTRFSKKVRLSGGGGESLRMFYNPNSQAYFNLIDKSVLSQRTKELVKSDLEATLNEFSYNQAPKQAMVDIYSKYRQRFFAGRAWYYALTGIVFAPMASKSYKSILLASDIEEVFGVKKEEIIQRNLIGLFLLYMLNPVLALSQFDEKKKNFSLSDLELIQVLVEPHHDIDLKKGRLLKTYGDIRSTEVMPDCFKSKIESDSCDSYDLLISRDLRGAVERLRALEIIDGNNLSLLEDNFKSGSLNKSETLALLHVNELLKRASFLF